MLCVSQDHSLSADAVHLVFLEMSESLDWSAMTCIVPLQVFTLVFA